MKKTNKNQEKKQFADPKILWPKSQYFNIVVFLRNGGNWLVHDTIKSTVFAAHCITSHFVRTIHIFIPMSIQSVWRSSFEWIRFIGILWKVRWFSRIWWWSVSDDTSMALLPLVFVLLLLLFFLSLVMKCVYAVCISSYIIVIINAKETVKNWYNFEIAAE